MELVMMFGIDVLTLLIAGLRNLTGIWSYPVEPSFLNSRMIFFTSMWLVKFIKLFLLSLGKLFTKLSWLKDLFSLIQSVDAGVQNYWFMAFELSLVRFLSDTINKINDTINILLFWVLKLSALFIKAVFIFLIAYLYEAWVFR